MLRLVFVLIISISNAEYQDMCGSDKYDRVGAFRRCIDVTTPFPPFDITKPTCTLSTAQLQEIVANSRYQQQYGFGCDDLIRFADYQQLNNVNLLELSSISLNSTHSKSLATAAFLCHLSATQRLCDHYNLCFSYRENATKAYERNACIMDFSRLVSHGSDRVFNEIIYKYLLKPSLVESYSQAGRFNLAITQDYLYTCTSLFHRNDIEDCIIQLLNHCFLFEDEAHYLCYNGIQDNFCSQFGGDNQLRCYILLEVKRVLSLESQCTMEYNENACEKILTSIVDEKPIGDLNSTDIDEVKAIVAGSSRRANYTNETLTQLNRIVDYFTLNESVVSQNIDKQDANTFLSVISTLASKEESLALPENNETNSSTALLNDLAVMSKLIGSAVLTSNDQVEGNFAYSDNNIGLFLTVGSVEYLSGALKLNSTNSSAEINIPPASVCGFDYELSKNDGSYEYDEYPKICQGRPSCNISQNGFTYTCYDMYTIFGECSKRIAIPRSCPSVVSTSIAKLSLPGTLPPNMTIASNVINVQIVTRNEDSSVSNVHSLKDNASLHFKLAEPIKENFIPKCHFWNTTENVWSDVGIETLVLSDVDILCNTSHLTSFAVLVDHQGLIESASSSTAHNGTSIIPSTELQALSIVGYIGPSISLLCLIIALVIMIYLRKEMNVNFLYHVHLNLCISLLLGLTVFLFGLETAIHYDWLCSIVAVLLHYLFLCVFAWMLAEGITLFITVVHVWGMKLLKWQISLLTAWGIPLFIVAVSFGIRHDLYGTDNYCWLSSQKGLVWAFLGPALAIAVINTIFLMVTMIQLVRVIRNKFDHRKNSKNLKTVKSAIFGAIVLFPLLGITWIIGVFAVSQNTTVFLWLFTICNSLQGVFILIFHVLRHKTVLTWIVRKYPCMDKWIEVHTSSEVIRRMSAMKLSVGKLAPQDMLSAKFGLRRNSSYSLSDLIVSTSNENCINSELDTIAEEGDDEGVA
ncbi:PREDICTED: adhesion G-protein coupled receptor F1-like [Amphimedon queenslandica]|uniref:G-protein coupled receptors family 2 profile 2 domain-containing protein n=2 Tax=Amphimedon queenslandica TaxID=400682 RepID=A0AAN0K4Q9_AMPQE|nr:PREDICTED: adhesion G-protein coupled receptor F1-like [Amphimedon queenslandica]|eukprot:XP_019864498.1 PREDICTED: adhesion G-protein coupled receptor F1-like [Amphimedon queenslandica]